MKTRKYLLWGSLQKILGAAISPRGWSLSPWSRAEVGSLGPLPTLSDLLLKVISGLLAGRRVAACVRLQADTTRNFGLMFDLLR